MSLPVPTPVFPCSFSSHRLNQFYNVLEKSLQTTFNGKRKITDTNNDNKQNEKKNTSNKNSGEVEKVKRNKETHRKQHNKRKNSNFCFRVIIVLTIKSYKFLLLSCLDDLLRSLLSELELSSTSIDENINLASSWEKIKKIVGKEEIKTILSTMQQSVQRNIMVNSK